MAKRKVGLKTENMQMGRGNLRIKFGESRFGRFFREFRSQGSGAFAVAGFQGLLKLDELSAFSAGPSRSDPRGFHQADHAPQAAQRQKVDKELGGKWNKSVDLQGPSNRFLRYVHDSLTPQGGYLFL